MSLKPEGRPSHCHTRVTLAKCDGGAYRDDPVTLVTLVYRQCDSVTVERASVTPEKNPPEEKTSVTAPPCVERDAHGGWG